jgi:hypothetical protein
MGYLNNATTVLDAILTKKGRELLARGKNEFQITKFALADDEVDYSLWDVSHPLGTDYYGTVIEALPLLEPVPDPNTVMRYKLVTRDVGTSQMAILTGINPSGYTVTWNGTTQSAGNGQVVTVETQFAPDTLDPDGYSFTILNSSICYLTAASNPDAGANDNSGINYVQSTQNVSQTVFGNSAQIFAKAIEKPAAGEPNPSTTLLVTGLTYGATASATITVQYIDNTSGQTPISG